MGQNRGNERDRDPKELCAQGGARAMIPEWHRRVDDRSQEPERSNKRGEREPWYSEGSTQDRVYWGHSDTLCLLLLLKLMLKVEFDTWGLGLLQPSRVSLGSVEKACGFCLVSAGGVRPLL